MPKITRNPKLENVEYPYVIEYTCNCGQEVQLFLTEKPNKLIKCFKCNRKYDDQVRMLVNAKKLKKK